jgi:hypothetical protein
MRKIPEKIRNFFKPGYQLSLAFLILPHAEFSFASFCGEAGVHLPACPYAFPVDFASPGLLAYGEAI